MTLGTRRAPLPARLMRSNRARAFGLGLLLIAGALCAYSADLTQGWRVGSRSRPGEDDWKFIGLGAGLFWLLLVPGMSLSLDRSPWWRVGAVGTGFAAWLVFADIFGPMPGASALYRAYWICFPLFVVWFFPLLYERNHGG